MIKLRVWPAMIALAIVIGLTGCNEHKDPSSPGSINLAEEIRDNDDTSRAKSLINGDFGAFALFAVNKRHEVWKSSSQEYREKALAPYYTDRFLKELKETVVLPFNDECDIAYAKKFVIIKRESDRIIVGSSDESICSFPPCEGKAVLVLTDEGWRVDHEICKEHGSSIY